MLNSLYINCIFSIFQQQQSLNISKIYPFFIFILIIHSKLNQMLKNYEKNRNLYYKQPLHSVFVSIIYI